MMRGDGELPRCVLDVRASGDDCEVDKMKCSIPVQHNVRCFKHKEGMKIGEVMKMIQQMETILRSPFRMVTMEKYMKENRVNEVWVEKGNLRTAKAECQDRECWKLNRSAVGKIFEGNKASELKMNKLRYTEIK